MLAVEFRLLGAGSRQTVRKYCEQERQGLNRMGRPRVEAHGCAKANVEVSVGRCKYKASKNCLEWKIPRFPGGEEAAVSANVELVSTTSAGNKPWSRPPIQMEFQVPMFTASGLRVRFLKVWERSGYDTVKWVRYLSKSGAYETRC